MSRWIDPAALVFLAFATDAAAQTLPVGITDQTAPYGRAMALELPVFRSFNPGFEPEPDATRSLSATRTDPDAQVPPLTSRGLFSGLPEQHALGSGSPVQSPRGSAASFTLESSLATQIQGQSPTPRSYSLGISVAGSFEIDDSLVAAAGFERDANREGQADRTIVNRWSIGLSMAF